MALAAALVVTTGLAPAVSAAPSMLGSPVLDLDFENTIADASALAHPVSFRGHQGSTTHNFEYVDGVEAGTKALKLNGNTSLDLGTSTELQPQNLTLSFWIKPTGALAGEHIISWNKQAFNSDGWYLSSESDTVPLALSIGPAGGQPYKVRVSAANRAQFLPADQWTHIVASYDRATKDVTFFRNGEQVPTMVSSAITGDATGVLGSSPTLPKTIGFNGPQYNGGYLRASLDKYKVFNGVAERGDVVELYEESGRVFDRQAVAQADADAISLPEEAVIALVLNAEGSRGSEIAWSSSAPDVISATGEVTRPGPDEADAEVTLTASVTFLGGPPVVRTFDITVPAEDAVEYLDNTALGDVVLSDDYLLNATQKEHEYLLSLSSNKFLFEVFKVSGLTPRTTEGYPVGWERSNAVNFRGHFFGHYMSALSMSFATSTDQTTKDALFVQIQDAITGLQEAQDAYAVTNPAGAGYVSAFRESILDSVQGTGTSNENVIVPWYNLHKILAGLLDVSEYVDGPIGDQAFDIAEEFGEYVYRRVSALPNNSVMLRTEYGGMNEALYELFDRSGGNPHFKVAAEAFDEVTLFQQLANNQDVLNGKHANTQIPKFIGALKRYTVFTRNPEYYAMLTPAEKQQLPMYLTAAENFFQIVVDHHTYVTGSNSQAEHFRAADSLHESAAEKGAGGNAETSETCNEYNMLKLARELFRETKRVAYMDYYENTFINTILSSQNPETGTTMYFQPMAPGFHKVFNMPFTEFWCCTGTGVENFSKLGDSIYFTGGGSVYVNMFFSSTLSHAAKNLRLTQTANMPNEDTVTFEVEALTGTAVDPNTTVRLRVPNWIDGEPTVTRNGAVITPALVRGYLVLENVQAGDVFEYTTPMKVVVHDTQDNANFVAFKYGPVVLSTALKTTPTTASTGTGILVRKSTFDSTAQTTITVAGGTTAEQWKNDVATNVVRIADSADGRVQFTLRNTADAGNLVYTPHFMRYQETYGLYMNLEEPDSQASQDRLLQSKVQQREQQFGLDSLTTFDNNNFENAKNLKTNGSSSVGQFNGRTYRDASGNGSWFSYDLQIDPSVAKNYLQITYYGGDAGRPAFNILANETLLKTYSIRQSTPSNQFYLDTTELTGAVLTNPRYKKDALGNDVLDDQGNRIPVVNIRIQATGWIAGGIFGIRTARSLDWDTKADLAQLQFGTGALTPSFDPATTGYTLSVPAGTASVDLNVDPHLPSGLVRVDGILIDDTAPRRVGLPADGSSKTVTVTGYAQDHTTKKDYTITIVQGGVAGDISAPTTVAAVTLGSPATVVLTATDEENGSGVAATRYRLGTGSWTDYTGPITVPRSTTALTGEFRSVDVAGNEEQIKSFDIPAAPAADLTTATACLNGKAVLTVRARNTGSTPADLTLVTGIGTKTFTNLAPKGLAAYNFAAPGPELSAGQVTVSSLTRSGGGDVIGTVVLPYPARTCG